MKLKIVLLHGLAGSRRIFSQLEKLLQESPEIETYSFDLLGFGENWHTHNKAFSREDHLSLISEKIEQRFGQDPIILLGHSMGGVLAIAWAAQNPQRVQKIILLNTPLGLTRADLESQIRKQKSGWGYFILAHRLSAFISCTLLCKGGLMTFFNFLKPAYVSQDVFHDYIKHSWTSLSRSFESVILLTPGLELVKNIIDVPILNLTGSEDSELSRRTIDQVNVINRELPGGHYILLENPKIISDEIKKFLVLR